MFHESNEPVETVPVAEISASSGDIAEAVDIAHALSQISVMHIKVDPCVDREISFTLLLSQQNFYR